MRSRLAILGALACGYTFVGCGSDSANGFGSDGGSRDGGLGGDATTLGGSDAEVAGDGGDDDASMMMGDDDDASGNGNDSGDDSGETIHDGGGRTDASDAGDASANDGGNHDAGDASDASQAGDADADAGPPATFLTPTCDGTIGATEYGTGTEGQDKYTTGTTVWHGTWNNTALYIGIEGATVTEATVFYMDTNGGTAPAGGTDKGFVYDGTNFSTLPFAADFVGYMKSGYHEYRNPDLADGWSTTPNTTQIQVCPNNNGTTRELVIPWTTSAGLVRPTTFSFFGAMTSSGGFVYGQVPTSVPAGQSPTGPNPVAHFFDVTNSGAGQSSAFSNPR